MGLQVFEKKNLLFGHSAGVSLIKGRVSYDITRGQQTSVVFGKVQNIVVVWGISDAKGGFNDRDLGQMLCSKRCELSFAHRVAKGLHPF